MADVEVAQALADLRKMLRASLATARLQTGQLAKRANLGRTTVSNALNDRHERPSQVTVKAMAKALGMDDDQRRALLELWERAAPREPVAAPREPVGQVISAEPPTRRRSTARVVGAAAGALIAALGVTAVVHWWPKGADAKSRNTSSSGKYLMLTAPEEYISDINWEESAVFPPSAVPSAPPGLFTQTKMPPEIPSESKLAADEMRAGGYLLGGATLSVDVRAAGAAQATIHDIRLVNLKRQPIVTGKAFITLGQGGDNENIQYLLDSPNPLGHSLPDGKVWSTTRHSDVTSKTKETFTLAFVALRYAYTFNVAFEYVVDGKNYTQILNGEDGKPLLMRVSADLCPLYRNQLSAAERARLGTLHYSSINSNALTNLYSVAAVDPKLYGPDGVACHSAPHNKVGMGR